MATTQTALEEIEEHAAESMGLRSREPGISIAPVASPRDVGRRPLRNVGRIAIDQVIPDPTQPRQNLAADSLERLAQSIRDKGQLSPIRVRWSATASCWIIVSGERRWRAARIAGIKTIDCIFHDGDLPPTAVLEEQLTENLLRDDLSPIEEAKALAKLMQLKSCTGKQLAESLNIATAQVSRALALLKLPAKIQHQVELGNVSARAAYQMARLNDGDTQRALAERAAAGQLTHAEAADAVRRQRGRPGLNNKKAAATRLTFLTERGWHVTVSCRRKGSYEEVE
jgi:ParB family chromosome partitioning protein